MKKMRVQLQVPRKCYGNEYKTNIFRGMQKKANFVFMFIFHGMLPIVNITIFAEDEHNSFQL